MAACHMAAKARHRLHAKPTKLQAAVCMPCPHLGHEESCNAFGAWLPSPRHDQVQVCCACARDEGLGAIQHVSAASPPGTGLQGCGVTATPRLCQAVGRQHAHVCQLGEPLLLLLPAPSPAGARRGYRGSGDNCASSTGRHIWGSCWTHLPCNDACHLQARRWSGASPLWYSLVNGHQQRSTYHVVDGEVGLQGSRLPSISFQCQNKEPACICLALWCMTAGHTVWEMSP